MSIVGAEASRQRDRNTQFDIAALQGQIERERIAAELRRTAMELAQRDRSQNRSEQAQARQDRLARAMQVQQMGLAMHDQAMARQAEQEKSPAMLLQALDKASQDYASFGGQYARFQPAQNRTAALARMLGAGTGPAQGTPDVQGMLSSMAESQAGRERLLRLQLDAAAEENRAERNAQRGATRRGSGGGGLVEALATALASKQTMPAGDNNGVFEMARRGTL